MNFMPLVIVASTAYNLFRKSGMDLGVQIHNPLSTEGCSLLLATLCGVATLMPPVIYLQRVLKIDVICLSQCQRWI